MKNLFVITLLMLGINQIKAQNVISIEADGNLESPNPLACVDLSAVTNGNNPADILNGMKKCIEIKEYEKAAKLFAIAGVYAKYDTFRVKDKTAHQGYLVMQMNIFDSIDESQKNSLMESLKKELKAGSSKLNETCQAIQKVGVPKYYPKYMIQHGIQAFVEKDGNGLIEKFDSVASWKQALNEYLHCGE
jgi:5-carboxymethyl-2-hydroxymuconate isomerase